jgi:hypothetical protein
MKMQAAVKVVLVDNIFLDRFGRVDKSSLGPHLGFASLAAVARHEGIDVEVVDPKPHLLSGALRAEQGLSKQLATVVLDRQPTVVGFTSLGCNFAGVVQTAAEIKRRCPTLPVMLGGPHATILAREIAEAFAQFDLIVAHEAESVFVQAVTALIDGTVSSVPGVTYRAAGQVVSTPRVRKEEDLSRLPEPAFDLYDVKARGLSTLRVEAGRGCPFECKFCSTATFFGRKYRLRPAPQLCAFLDKLSAEYSVRDFVLNHDLFTVNRKAILEYCEELRPRNYSWSCSARLDCVDRELLAEMKAAGCRSIYFGVEVGTERLQRETAKRLDIGLLKPTAEACAALGIAATYSFITGFPEEGPDDQAALLDHAQWLLALDASVTVQLHLLSPEPGTATYRQHSSTIRYDGFFSDFTFPLVEADDEALVRSHPDIFCGHYYYDTVKVARARHVLTVTAFQSMAVSGQALFLQICTLCGGGLKGVVEALEEWTRLGKRSPVIDGSALCEFVDSVAGSSHPLSLVLRVVSDARTQGRAEGLRDHIGEARRRRLRRAPFTRISRTEYDVSAFLAHLEATPTVAWKANASGTTTVALSWDHAGERVRVYELGEASAWLLEHPDVVWVREGYVAPQSVDVDCGVSSEVVACVQRLVEARLLVASD